MPDDEQKPADLKVEVDDSRGPAKWHWISVVGVGTFLIVPVVFWMMNMISGLIEKTNDTIEQTNGVIDRNTAVVSASTEQMKDVEADLEASKRVMQRLYEKIGDEEP